MVHSFSDFNLAPYLTKALEEKDIKEPTDIQIKAIPEILDGQDVIARSQTGSGKTLAFLLPILNQIDSEKKDLQAVILAPTNELAMQIFDVLKDLTKDSSIIADSFLGSANVKRQIEKLKKSKPQVAVGTPTRVLELAESKKLKLHLVKCVVVDEADRMLAEKPTWQAFQAIASRVGREGQYIFVSATIPENFQDLVGQNVQLPVMVTSEGSLIDSERVEHLFIVCEAREKIEIARKLIRNLEIKKGLLFVNHLDKVTETTDKLKYREINAKSLSADSTKVERANVMKEFQEGKIEILVASDLAARGLDINDITHVINIHPPVDADAYLHRAGRTGRMGKSGVVISIMEPKELFIIKKFEKALNIKIEERRLEYGNLISENSPKNIQTRKKKS
ncbi:DEAD/DEAH box helicase [Bacillus sp. FJAT-45350]|uniref:DEAD/DEAH box helicase n=1 Tax=Bacillus sp. FJAT-45350 TaxID=2011014 RepID=UPI000BB7BE7D|nr:DEAD/DEAH box helicase [Bacillus sp. FJAT-45350]